MNLHETPPSDTLSFDQLPPDWPTRPLTDPFIASGVVDLCVPLRDRDAWSVAVLLCDADSRLLQPCLVGDVPRVSNDLDKLRLLKPFAQFAREQDGGLLVVRARPGQRAVDEEDRSWARVAQHACDVRSVPLVGVWLATPRGIRRVDDPHRLAA